MLKAVLLAALGALPTYKEDRAAERAAAKSSQLETIASAVADAAAAQAPRWPGAPRELAALLLAVGYHESAFALHIGEGRCRAWECDRGRAVSHWQLHERAASSSEAWQLARTDIHVAAREAARALVRSRWMCRSLERHRTWLEMTLSAYAGRGCTGYFGGRERRVATFNRLVSR